MALGSVCVGSRTVRAVGLEAKRQQLAHREPMIGIGGKAIPVKGPSHVDLDPVSPLEGQRQIECRWAMALPRSAEIVTRRRTKVFANAFAIAVSVAETIVRLDIAP